MAATSVLRKAGSFSQCFGCFRSYTKNIGLDIKSVSRRLCTGVSVVNEDVPEKRKEFRKFRSRLYRQNRMNPELERRARQGNLTINLDAVHKDWLAKGLQSTRNLAKHYGIFEHIFAGLEFKPTVLMKIIYEQGNQEVKWGNFVSPSQAKSCPTVDFQSDSGTYWTLILTNPDGNIWDKDSELLHWFVANIPGNKVSEGDVIREYIPPIPPKGTGFHRYVFCLLRQKDKLNLDKYTPSDSSFSSQWTFKLAELLHDNKDDVTPAGLGFFQAAWDETVSNTYLETLGIAEPVYDLKPFITPTYKRKNTTTVTFENKYRNM
ncbi:39S ribosomal protein L38, mitochondrial-like isoform X2 [Actinia tenebrosa]|uniref:Large ribosomal subunit protein mL38 n=1 Tax=Actinia tenebrosa TaxID=6105 RepID=A0A6P8HUJ2_ACTTE|nr:39S ribosomal protein L38, mitochondrial-like isoform X2 [Actinia tenebrosa]